MTWKVYRDGSLTIYNTLTQHHMCVFMSRKYLNLYLKQTLKEQERLREEHIKIVQKVLEIDPDYFDLYSPHNGCVVVDFRVLKTYLKSIGRWKHA